MNIIYECAKLMGNKLHQSDEIFIKDNIFAVADGMGDKGSGKLAAKIAIQILSSFLDDIENAFKEINRQIINRLSRYDDGLICGSTLSVLKIDLDNLKFYIYHVGDSKIFLIRDEKLIQLSFDQSKIENHKKYVKALGVNWNVDIFKIQGIIEKDDIFILATDGICEQKDIFKDMSSKDIDDIKNQILNNSKNLEDNLSFILVKVF